VGADGFMAGVVPLIIAAASRFDGFTSGAGMTPDYKNKSQTAFGVAIICGGFVLETVQLTRGHPYPATKIILGILAVVFIGALLAGITWHRKWRASV
jgi:hypothetical protein